MYSRIAVQVYRGSAVTRAGLVLQAAAQDDASVPSNAWQRTRDKGMDSSSTRRCNTSLFNLF